MTCAQHSKLVIQPFVTNNCHIYTHNEPTISLPRQLAPAQLDRDFRSSPTAPTNGNSIGALSLDTQQSARARECLIRLIVRCIALSLTAVGYLQCENEERCAALPPVAVRTSHHPPERNSGCTSLPRRGGGGAKEQEPLPRPPPHAPAGRRSSCCRRRGLTPHGTPTAPQLLPRVPLHCDEVLLILRFDVIKLGSGPYLNPPQLLPTRAGLCLWRPRSAPPASWTWRAASSDAILSPLPAPP